MAQVPQVATTQQPAKSDIREYRIMVSDDLNARTSGKQKAVRVYVDFTGFDLEIAKRRFFVSTSPRVALQSKLRKKFVDEVHCKAIDFGTHGGIEVVERPMTAAEMIEAAAAGKFTPEQARALSEQLARMTATR